jgi:exoribonuclease R
MNKHSCQIEDREYSVWRYDPCNHELLSPMEYKLFNDDEISVDGNGSKFTGICIVHSPVRNTRDIPGILLLELNRTFGRTPNKKRLYYKCKPYDTKLPHFLIPYDIPIGFNKNYKNKYVTFSFGNWEDKHPVGVLTQTLGDVHDFPAYCEYALYCKQLHSSIIPSITKTNLCLKQKTVEEYKNIILSNPDMYGEFLKRKNEYIFAIDPDGCADRDDALSITYASTTSGCREYKVSVYIANVWVWLELFKLWDTTGNRVSTIYLPNMKRPMLPTSISEKICSLDADGSHRFCFVMDFVVFENPVKKDIRIIGEPTLNQCSVNVSANFVYEENSLLEDRNYQLLKTMTQKLDGGSTIKDSHDVVAYWMTQMNYYSAKLMKQNKIGIFRTVHQIKHSEHQIPSGMPKIIRILEQHISGSYKIYSDSTNLNHDTLGLSEYIHFTSPIRRLVDLLNQIKWVMDIIAPPLLSDRVTEFFNTQIGKIGELNSKMKKIRRIQSDCDILYKATDATMRTTYDGIVVSIDVEGNKCTVYIEELKWMTENVGCEYEKFDRVKCKLYVFENEEQMKRKIRIQIIV